MDREIMSRLSAVLLVVLCAALLGFAGAPCQGRTTRMMAALRKELETDPPPSPAKRVEACVRLLQEEMASPSAPEFGIGGGPIDSGYLQEVIMGVVGVFPQRAAQREEIRALLAARLASTPASNQALRERFTIMLGYTGDRAVVPQLVRMLEQHPEGFMRFSAVMALREIEQNEDAVPALQRAVASDTYARIRSGSSIRLPGQHEYDSITMVYSPVRDMAAQILRRKGVSVPKGIEVLEAKYAVQRLEPLLYDRRNPISTCRMAAIEALEMIGGIEAKAALRAFIGKEIGMTGMTSLVERAQKAADKLDAGR
jgi:hypothetical protein